MSNHTPPPPATPEEALRNAIIYHFDMAIQRGGLPETEADWNRWRQISRFAERHKLSLYDIERAVYHSHRISELLF